MIKMLPHQYRELVQERDYLEHVFNTEPLDVHKAKENRRRFHAIQILLKNAAEGANERLPAG